MGDRIGAPFKAAAMAFILLAIGLSALLVSQPGTAYARANLTAYQTVPPNGWEPKGYDVNGTAPWLIVNTLGWNRVKLMGNVGLGDGSVSYLNATSNRDHHYTDSYILAADISMAPIDVGRMGSYGGALLAPQTSNVSSIQNNTSVKNSTYITEAGGSGIVNPGRNIALNDPYHTILVGRPVDDMMYQYPLSPTISAYGRLVGLPLPGGKCVNIGMRSLSYGY